MVSVIISFYERWKHLAYCLEALESCRKDFDEVIVSDDGSSENSVDKVKEIVRSYDFTIRHTWQPKRGFRAAAARNNGVRHARGDYLVFLDCDLAVLRDTIKEHLRAAKPGRFVAGNCKYLSEEQTDRLLENGCCSEMLENVYQTLPERGLARDHRKFLKRNILFRLKLASPRKQSLGGHFSIHRKDFEYVNGYDESFVGWGGEDEDLGIRLVTAGIYGRSAIRKARALHLWHPREIGGKDWRTGPNIAYFRRKHIPFFCENGLKKGRS